MSQCPCGSGLHFNKCCKPFLLGKALPKTAEQLMRSRYSAYSKAEIKYIDKTQAKSAALGFNAQDALGWAKTVQWLRLQVLSHEAGAEGDTTGTVEFIATYRSHGKLHKLHEKSLFEKIGGLWFYVGEKRIVSADV